MTTQTRPFPFLLACAVLTPAALIIVYLTRFVLLPDFDTMSVVQIQAWVSGPFVPLAYAMICLILVASILLGWALVMHRRTKRPLGKVWFVGAVITIFLFFLDIRMEELGNAGAVILAMPDPEMASQDIHDWNFFSQVNFAMAGFVIIVFLTHAALAIATWTRSSGHSD